MRLGTQEFVIGEIYMRTRPSENNSHELQRKKLRFERSSEERQLRGLISRLESKLSQQLRISAAQASKSQADAA